MNILFIFPQIPYPPHSGGRIVTWNTVKRFARTCHVTIVCLYHHPDELQYLDEVKTICDEVAAFPAGSKWSFSRLWRSLLSTAPYKAHRFWNRQMADYLSRLVGRRSFDVIHAQNFYTAAYVRGDAPCFKVHYKENLEGHLLLRLGRYSKNPFWKVAAFLEGFRTWRYEAKLCRRFDRVLTISPLDRDRLLHFDPALSVQHQPPGVDLEAYPFLDEPDGPPSVLFTGTLSYYPNAIGVKEFLQSCWPLVRKKIPQIECWIVGADPPKDLQRMDGREGIHVTGRVASIDEYLKKCLVYIVPLTLGGGIRLKLLEAMASGRSIVSTPIGMEGLELKPDEHLKVSPLAEPFARSLIELVKNPSERNRLRRNARTLIEKVYDWDVVIPSQVEMYRCRSHPAPEEGLE